VIAVIQRVTRASVEISGSIVGAIGPGLLALVAVERGDGKAEAERLTERILGYRIFGDDTQRMNLSLADTGGGLLLVSQFTLAADTRKGLRPSFTPAAKPDTGLALFNHLVACAQARHTPVATGEFGADMQV
jgi:D-tyrosyl-tRNA(Tyr) deacylase